MADRNLIERIEGILNRLSIPVTAIDREYDAQVNAFAEGVITLTGGAKYLPVPQTGLALSCKEDVPGGDALLKLACEMAASLGHAGDSHMESSYDVYRRALRGELDSLAPGSEGREAALRELAAQYFIEKIASSIGEEETP